MRKYNWYGHDKNIAKAKQRPSTIVCSILKKRFIVRTVFTIDKAYVYGIETCYNMVETVASQTWNTELVLAERWPESLKATEVGNKTGRMFGSTAPICRLPHALCHTVASFETLHLNYTSMHGTYTKMVTKWAPTILETRAVDVWHRDETERVTRGVWGHVPSENFEI